jgi:hypothetical protein
MLTDGKIMLAFTGASTHVRAVALLSLSTIKQFASGLQSLAAGSKRTYGLTICCLGGMLRLTELAGFRTLTFQVLISRELTQSNRLAKITMWFCDRVLLNAQNMSGHSRNKEVL